MSTDCFTYGSLMCADIMDAVTGRPCSGEPARLAGYRRRPVRGEEYPGIAAAPGGEVDGVLYRGVEADALARLDAFEGDMYRRVEVAVMLADGRTTTAQTYLFRPDLAHLLEDREWDFERFVAEGKTRFQARYMAPRLSGGDAAACAPGNDDAPPRPPAGDGARRG